MTTIDLHGVRYRDVYSKLEKHCINGEIPFVVITGESSTMKDIVSQVAQQFGFFIEDKLAGFSRILRNLDTLRACTYNLTPIA